MGTWYTGAWAGEETFLEVLVTTGGTGPCSFGLGFCDGVGAFAVEELCDCYLKGGFG